MCCAALIIRAISVLEGIALVADPEFQIIQAAYPFISRKLLTDQSPRLKAALHYMVRLLPLLFSHLLPRSNADPISCMRQVCCLKFKITCSQRPVCSKLLTCLHGEALLLLPSPCRSTARTPNLMRPD